MGGFSGLDGPFERDNFVLQLLVHRSAPSGCGLEEPSFHALVVLFVKACPPLPAQVDTACMRLEVSRLQDAMGEQPHGERVDDGGAEGLDEVESE